MRALDKLADASRSLDRATEDLMRDIPARGEGDLPERFYSDGRKITKQAKALSRKLNDLFVDLQDLVVEIEEYRNDW